MRPVRLPSAEPDAAYDANISDATNSTRARRRHKYGAKRTEVDGIVFASKREANRYQELRLLEKAGEINELSVQPRFELHVPERLGTSRTVIVGHYTADFRYREGPQGLLKIEDVKSSATRTTAYRLRKRMVEATYGITISEV